MLIFHIHSLLVLGLTALWDSISFHHNCLQYRSYAYTPWSTAHRYHTRQALDFSYSLITCNLLTKSGSDLVASDMDSQEFPNYANDFFLPVGWTRIVVVVEQGKALVEFWDSLFNPERKFSHRSCPGGAQWQELPRKTKLQMQTAFQLMVYSEHYISLFSNKTFNQTPHTIPVILSSRVHTHGSRSLPPSLPTTYLNPGSSYSIKIPGHSWLQHTRPQCLWLASMSSALPCVAHTPLSEAEQQMTKQGMRPRILRSVQQSSNQ